MPEAIADRAVRWIKELPGHMKANHRLALPHGHCCLGVAGKLAGIPDEKMLASVATNCYLAIEQIYGLRSTIGSFRERTTIDEINAHSLTAVNDSVYTKDTDHTRTAAFIRANVDLVWPEPVATLIKERLEKPNTDGPIQPD